MSTTITMADAAPGAEPRPLTAGRIWRAGLLAGLAAAVANVIVFLVAGALGVPLQVPMQGPGSPLAPLTAVPVIIATVLPAIVATALFVVLNRVTRQPQRWFLVTAVAFLVLSLAPVLSLPIPAATQLALNLMHVVAAAVIAGGLLVLTRDR